MGAFDTIWLLCLAIVTVTVSSVSSTSCHSRRLNVSDISNDGYLTSPGYPERYAPSQCIMWLYYGSPGTHVYVRFDDLYIPTTGEGCKNDRLIIGPIDEHNYCGNSDLQRFEPYEADLTDIQYVFYIVFNSTSEGWKGRGFKIYYRFGNKMDSPARVTTTPDTTTSTLMQPDILRCQFVMTTRTGVISPGAGILTRNGGLCTWLVYDPFYPESSAKFQVEFEYCHLPFSAVIEIFDGRSTSHHKIGTYHGLMCPNFVMSTGNGFVLRINLNQDENVSQFSLQIKYNLMELQNVQGPLASMQPPHTAKFPTTQTHLTGTEKPIVHHMGSSCKVNIRDQEGEIRSNDFFKYMDDSGFCTILLHNSATDGHHVTYSLQFENFHLYPESLLNIYDGMSTEHLLEHFTANYHPQYITTPNNSVLIYFKPGRYSENNGQIEDFTISFEMNVHCDANYRPCGFGEYSCYYETGRCNGIWDCPVHGGDERKCSTDCPEFGCGPNSMYCYTEDDRCNGKGTCPNYVDEMGCTSKQCSQDKGLFLCGNGRCIYDKWRCDRTNDCADNSDELDCSSLTSPRVVVAAVVGSLACSLLLVVALGCVCKVYQLRVHQLRGGPRHDTPFSRQLAEMFHRRAPPPPYHEAMLTSRPYDEAYLELLNQTENENNSSTPGNSGDQQQSGNSASGGEGPRGNRRHGNRRCRHGHRHRNVNQGQSSVTAPSSETSGLFEVGTLPSLTEEDGTQGAASLEPPPYSESDPSSLASLIRLAESSSDSEECSDDDFDETWQGSGGVDNTGYTDDASSGSLDGESSIQMEMMSATVRNPADLSVPSSVSHSRNSGGNRTGLRENNRGDNEDDDDGGGEGNGSDKDEETASTSLSVDSANDPPQVVEENGDKIQGHMTVIEEDSDSECILHEDDDINDDDDANDDTDSDTACLLSQV